MIINAISVNSIPLLDPEDPRNVKKLVEGGLYSPSKLSDALDLATGSKKNVHAPHEYLDLAIKPKVRTCYDKFTLWHYFNSATLLHLGEFYLNFHLVHALEINLNYSEAIKLVAGQILYQNESYRLNAHPIGPMKLMIKKHPLRSAGALHLPLTEEDAEHICAGLNNLDILLPRKLQTDIKRLFYLGQMSTIRKTITYSGAMEETRHIVWATGKLAGHALSLMKTRLQTHSWFSALSGK